jgi:hypothetical protein
MMDDGFEKMKMEERDAAYSEESCRYDQEKALPKRK